MKKVIRLLTPVECSTMIESDGGFVRVAVSPVVNAGVEPQASLSFELSPHNAARIGRALIQASAVGNLEDLDDGDEMEEDEPAG